MIQPRLVLCSGIEISETDKIREGKHVVELDSIGDNSNVHLRIEQIAKIFRRNFSPRLVDLLEITSYIYTADAATQRGVDWTNNHSTECWDRNFHFVIPVRDLNFWQSEQVNKLLVKIIKFISNDEAKFDFVKLEKERVIDEYLEFGDNEDWELCGIDRVTMFSGGLDSLAGVCEKANAKEALMLVSHSPVNSTLSRQTRLYQELKNKFEFSGQHIPVVINKNAKLGRDFLQRTRSLLFSAIGTIIAESVKAKGVRFYENGIVSINLPVAEEVKRARASKTTHPHTLTLFSELYSLVTEREFIIDNPYLFKTKADIIEVIKENNAQDLIEFSCSCAHTGFFQSKSQWHCGTCSQCIDRRIAVFAAGVEDYDPETGYVEDVFTGKRDDTYKKNIAVNIARHALELQRMSEPEIATQFNMEFARSVRHLTRRSEAIGELIKLHKRHGETVCKVLSQQLAKHSDKFVSGEIEKSSMLFAIAGKEHTKPSWKEFSEKIIYLLNNGIPKICETNKPKNEPHLQEICDGVLQANENILTREFPYKKWSSGATKPDWSKDECDLWVEAKYVREKKDLGQIREAMAADITKYGDNNQKVLFFIYDPHHIIINEAEFANPINQRESMTVHFLR